MTNLWTQFMQQLFRRSADLLDAIQQHMELVFWSILLAIIIGIPLGILIARHHSLRKWVMGISNIMQTIPSLALLGFMIPLFGIGKMSAIATLFLYSLLPIISNTYTGIQGVDNSIVEAAKGLGMTRAQILFKVKIPLAISMIMTGIRIAVVINIGTATLAAFVGAGGLGEFIFLGISRNMDALVLLGAIPAALLTLVIDILLRYIERKVTPAGLQLEKI